jgi:hypothetical protein
LRQQSFPNILGLTFFIPQPNVSGSRECFDAARRAAPLVVALASQFNRPPYRPKDRSLIMPAANGKSRFHRERKQKIAGGKRGTRREAVSA